MRTAVCTGSFDPITLGHLDVIRRAAACFDRLWVCVSVNAEKRNQMFTPEQKLLLAQTAVADLPNVEAELCSGLVADFPAGDAAAARQRDISAFQLLYGAGDDSVSSAVGEISAGENCSPGAGDYE